MATIEVMTETKKFHTAQNFYGLFFEDINRSGDGCLYPELIRNRAFEDSIPPERVTMLDGKYGFETPNGWRDQFNNGEGLQKWLDDVLPTDIPGWYSERANMSLTDRECLNKNRLRALYVAFQKDGYIYNAGFKGISIKEKEAYRFYMFAKVQKNIKISVSLESKSGMIYASKEIDILSRHEQYQKYEIILEANGTDTDAILKLKAASEGNVYIGFTSCMPVNTYKNHGMNSLIMELLAATNSRFLRFPGGCIVEGFTKETAMRFKNTIGPVWERPSHTLMWHYRSTNGLGFHEYLQICEDLNLEALYVINCGITCQGRKPELFCAEELDEILDDAVAALEYATAPADSEWGAKRAEAGHPEPFSIKYVEIGNENVGEEYEERYEIFYERLKQQFPDIIFISNTHTELKGLPTEVVDEHLYSTADAFVTAGKKYELYDRTGPEIFIGEYAVTSGTDVGNLRSALAESMYLIDLEKNQDIVTMTAYAPLIQNIHYTSWEPNLIVYDGTNAYGIPFYYAMSMMAGNRGKYVAESKIEGREEVPRYKGLYGLVLYKNGMKVKNIFVNEKKGKISHNILGTLRIEDEHIMVSESDYVNEYEGHPNMGYIPPNTTYVTFGNDECTEGKYEVEVFMESEEIPLDLCMWVHNCPMIFSRDETRPLSKEWNAVYTDRCIWHIEKSEGSFASVNRFNNVEFGEKKKLPIKYGQYNKFMLVTNKGRVECYLNNIKIQEARLTPYPVISEVATVDEDFIYLKIVNYSLKDERIDITLDCNVLSEYEAEILQHENEKAKNTFENPYTIIPKKILFQGAGKKFTYNALKNSLNILRLKKADK